MVNTNRSVPSADRTNSVHQVRPTPRNGARSVSVSARSLPSNWRTSHSGGGGELAPPGPRAGSTLAGAAVMVRPGDFRIRITNARQIPHTRLGAQVLERGVGARLFATSYHLGAGLVQRAEHDGIRRTRLLTRSADIRAAQRSILAPRRDACFSNALHAERAFLHHAALAHGDVRV